MFVNNEEIEYCNPVTGEYLGVPSLPESVTKITDIKFYFFNTAVELDNVRLSYEEVDFVSDVSNLDAENFDVTSSVDMKLYRNLKERYELLTQLGYSFTNEEMVNYKNVEDKIDESKAYLTLSDNNSYLVNEDLLVLLNSETADVKSVIVNEAETQEYSVIDNRILIKGTVLTKTGENVINIKNGDTVGTAIAELKCEETVYQRESSNFYNDETSTWATASDWNNTGYRENEVWKCDNPTDNTYYGWNLTETGKYKILYLDISTQKSDQQNSQYGTNKISVSVNGQKTELELDYSKTWDLIGTYNLNGNTKIKIQVSPNATSANKRLFADSIKLVKAAENTKLYSEYLYGDANKLGNVKLEASDVNYYGINSDLILKLNGMEEISGEIYLNGVQLEKNTDYKTNGNKILLKGSNFPTVGKYGIELKLNDAVSFEIDITIKNYDDIIWYFDSENVETKGFSSTPVGKNHSRYYSLNPNTSISGTYGRSAEGGNVADIENEWYTMWTVPENFESGVYTLYVWCGYAGLNEALDVTVTNSQGKQIYSNIDTEAAKAEDVAVPVMPCTHKKRSFFYLYS